VPHGSYLESEAYWPLKIAKEASERVQELTRMGAAHRDEAERQSAVTIVFAAAAVEAALNAFISRPILRIEDPATREFFGLLIHRHLRGSAPSKLMFLRKVWAGAEANSEVLKRVDQLFLARNALLHITPDYVVALGVNPDASWQLGAEYWMEYSGLQWTKQDVIAPGAAEAYFDAAGAFLAALTDELNYKPLGPAM
jgi:hypothetical protein